MSEQIRSFIAFDMKNDNVLNRIAAAQKLLMQTNADLKMVEPTNIHITLSKVGCNHYGKTLACPPYTPSAEEFRKIVGEYSYAMFMKFTSNAQAEPEVLAKLMVAETDPTVSRRNQGES